MISIGNITFIIIIQSIILLILLSGFLFFLLRTKNKKITVLSNTTAEKNEMSPLASVEFYLTAEIKLIESRFGLLFSDEDLANEEFGEADWLALRKDFLDIEKDLLTETDRLDSLWIDVGKKVKETLKNNHLVKRTKTQEINDDDDAIQKEMKTLLKSQYDDFDSLYLELEGEKTEAEVADLKEKMNSVIRSHTELSHCMYTLENENLFLRDQVKELLNEGAKESD